MREETQAIAAPCLLAYKDGHHHDSALDLSVSLCLRVYDVSRPSHSAAGLLAGPPTTHATQEAALLSAHT